MAVGGPVDQPHLPRRPGEIGQDAARHVLQPLRAAGLGDGRVPHVITNREAQLVHPYRIRQVEQNGLDAAHTEHVPDEVGAAGRGPFEHGHRAELQRGDVSCSAKNISASSAFIRPAFVPCSQAEVPCHPEGIRTEA